MTSRGLEGKSRYKQAIINVDSGLTAQTGDVTHVNAAMVRGLKFQSISCRHAQVFTTACYLVSAISCADGEDRRICRLAKNDRSLRCSSWTEMRDKNGTQKQTTSKF